MKNLMVTHHAETRMSQRGIRSSDIDLLLVYATEMGGGRLMLRAKDVDRAVGELKRLMATLQRLKNKVLVVAEGSVVTAYHYSGSGQAHRRRAKARRRARTLRAPDSKLRLKAP